MFSRLSLLAGVVAALLPALISCTARPKRQSVQKTLVNVDGSISRAKKALLRTESIAKVIEGCPLPYKDISTTSWCELHTRSGKVQIATYGVQDGDVVSQTVCKEHVWENHRSAEDLGIPKGFKSADGGPPRALDIGGNIGVTMMLFAKSGYRVTVVEAMTQNRKLLNATLCANPDLQALVSVESAIVGTPEQAGGVCKVCIDFGGDATVLCPGDSRGPECDSMEPQKQKQMKEEIRVKTLDQIVAEHKLPHVDVVKMDIEGYECQAIKGAHDLLNKMRPRYVMSEIQNNPPSGALVGCTPSEFVDIFRKARYDVFTDRFGGKRLVGEPKIDMYGSPNFFFVSQD